MGLSRWEAETEQGVLWSPCPTAALCSSHAMRPLVSPQALAGLQHTVAATAPLWFAADASRPGGETSEV